MRFQSVRCPQCEFAHQFLFSREKDRHLRRCPGCNDWYVIRERGDGSVGVESLDGRASCPVDGCEASVTGDGLPAHIINEHAGSLAPET